MKVVYHDFGGSHSTATAAAIHLGLIPEDKVPDSKDLLTKVPFFDSLTAPDHGRLFFMGVDEQYNQVYLLPRANRPDLVLNAVLSTIENLGGDPDEWIFVNTLPTVNLWMRIGGYLSRRLGIVALGRPMAIFGTRCAFHNISRLVRSTKAALREMPEGSGPKAARRYDKAPGENQKSPSGG